MSALSRSLWATVATAAGLGLVALVATAGCAPPVDSSPSESFHGATMGTTYAVKVVVAPGAMDGQRRAETKASIERELRSVDEAMSTYRPDSELSRFNRSHSTEPFIVSPATATVLAEALRIAELSGGALDVTVGPLVDAWGFGPAPATGEAVPAAKLDALRRRVGWRHLRLGEGTIAKAVADLHLDLSAVAKGYAVDRVAETLEEAGFDRYMVEVGGEVRARGDNAQGRPWQIGIERPTGDGRTVQRIVPLDDAALATSGDYRNYRELEGERISHIIDPRTGRPIRHRLASVSVVDSHCVRADALATALLVLGPQEGYDLAEHHGIASLFLIHDDSGGFTERATSHLLKLIAVTDDNPS